MRIFLRKVAQLSRPAVLFAACGLLVLTIPANVRTQRLQARLSVASVAPARIHIDLEFPTPVNVLSFRNAYGPALGLGERIENVEASDGSGQAIPVRRLAAGEFESDEKFTRVSYAVSVTEPTRPALMSHVSWLNREHGLLLPADLLPKRTRDRDNFSSVTIGFEVPTGWTIASNVPNEGRQLYSMDDPDKAVFLIGPALLHKSQRIASTNFTVVTSGKWPLSGSDAIKTARKIIEGYSGATGFELKRDSILMLIPFPGEPGPERWTAETRGNSVVLLLGRKASGKRVRSMLGIVLSHELFHLWVPNSLTLDGDYDWFFEGFTLYQALRTSLRLGLISFEDYLDTIARVYDSYLSWSEHEKLSPIEASERRWTTSSSLVYDQGMLIAFLYDLRVRELSECKRSIDDVYRQLFRLYSTGQANANETIIKVLTEQEGLKSFAQDYVERAGRINLQSALTSYGIQLLQGESGTQATKLVVGRDVDKAQRRLLKCLGY